MSENIKKFFEEIKGNKELQEKFKDVTDANEIVDIAKAAGYDITVADIEAVAKVKKGELNDDELESVAGGICFFLSNLNL